MKKYILIFLITAFVFSAASAQTYYISTIAGNDTVGFTGDGGQATAAELDNPIHSVADKLGNLYIADNVNQRVREVSTTGVITTIAGTGTMGNTGDGGAATAAELNAPVALAIDDSGNLYICNRGSCVVRKVNTNGIISTVAGNGTIGFSGDDGPATKAQLGEPRGVALDDSGNIYIADFANSCIRKVDKKSDTITTVAGMGYVFGYTGDGGPATAAKLNYAAQLAIDDSGNIYIDDYDNNVIRKVNNKGIISTFAGNGSAGFSGDGGPATDAQLNGPLGVAADKAGNVFITDYLSQRVRRVDKGDTITTIAGTGVKGHTGDGGPALSAELYSSAGINLDTLGNLYISELSSPGNDDIRKLSPCASTLDFSPVSPESICLGQSIVLSVTGGTLYQWSPSAGLNNTTGDTVIANPVVTTTYSVTSQLSGCNASGTIVVLVSTPPAKPTITQNGFVLISSATQGNQWLRNDTILKGATNQTYTFTIFGYYQVTTENPANGCSSTSDSDHITSGINQLIVNSGQLAVYPNPTGGEISVNISSSAVDMSDWKLQIVDVLGRTVYTKQSLNYNNDIDLSNLSSGVYFITVINKTGRVVVPVVKQ